MIDDNIQRDITWDEAVDDAMRWQNSKPGEVSSAINS